jgi:hypothetical protein
LISQSRGLGDVYKRQLFIALFIANFYHYHLQNQLFLIR